MSSITLPVNCPWCHAFQAKTVQGADKPNVLHKHVVCAVQAQRQARPGPKLKQLHWVKLNTPQQGTIWQRVDVSQAKLNFAQLEANFQVRTFASTGLPYPRQVCPNTSCLW